jgi:hypothetical protein
MRRVLISVEGQTEETFVREVLAQHLWELEIDPRPVLVSTKVVKSGPSFKGGLISYERTKRDILRLLGDTSAAAVTTMYDLYGLPQDFPGYQARPAQDCYAKVEHLESALNQDIGHRRFRAYLQLHEFEALLFVDPETTAAQFPASPHLEALRATRAAFDSPEEIDDHPETAPSRRLLDLFPGYQKPLHGPLITIQVGLERIRRECAHFDRWLGWLEGLGQVEVRAP